MIFFSRLAKAIELNKQVKKWREKNAHNNTTVEKMFDISKVSVGNGTYGVINPYFYNNPECSLTIGSYCSIAEGTKFVYGEHDYRRPMTFPINAYVAHTKEINPVKGPIIVEDDVWIGMNAIILSGVTIHQGAVIGAGSVVAKDIPPYAIYAGGRIIKYRFDEETIAKLLKMDWGKLSQEDILRNKELLYKELGPEFFESEVYNGNI